MQKKLSSPLIHFYNLHLEIFQSHSKMGNALFKKRDTCSGIKAQLQIKLSRFQSNYKIILVPFYNGRATEREISHSLLATSLPWLR